MTQQAKNCFAGFNIYISFFQLKCTIIHYMGFILVKTQLLQEKNERILFSLRF